MHEKFFIMLSYFAEGGPWKLDNLRESNFRAHALARQQAVLRSGGRLVAHTGEYAAPSSGPVVWFADLGTV